MNAEESEFEVLSSDIGHIQVCAEMPRKRGSLVDRPDETGTESGEDTEDLEKEFVLRSCLQIEGVHPSEVGNEMVKIPREVPWGMLLDIMAKEGIRDFASILDIDVDRSRLAGRVLAPLGKLELEGGLVWPSIWPSIKGSKENLSKKELTEQMEKSKEIKKNVQEELEKAKQMMFNQRWAQMDREEKAHEERVSLCPGSFAQKEACLGAKNWDKKFSMKSKRMEEKIKILEKRVDALQYNFFQLNPEPNVKSEGSDSDDEGELEYNQILKKLEGLRTFGQGASKEMIEKERARKKKKNRRESLGWEDVVPGTYAIPIERPANKQGGLRSSDPARSRSRDRSYFSPGRSTTSRESCARRKGRNRSDSRSRRTSISRSPSPPRSKVGLNRREVQTRKEKRSKNMAYVSSNSGQYSGSGSGSGERGRRVSRSCRRRRRSSGVCPKCYSRPCTKKCRNKVN